MSFNQSRSDKNEAQYRRGGRSGSFNPQRGPSGAYGRGSGGPAPSPSISSNRSYNKKSNNNAQGGQSRAPSGPAVNPSPESNARGLQNGAYAQPQFHGASDAPVPVPVPVPVPAAKQAEPSAASRSSRGVPKAPTSHHPPGSVNTTATSTPTKSSVDGSKPLLQFGSISPGFVNGMQIPARTSSAPPNLDEQKRDQVRQESYRAPSALPTPAPKPQVSRKDLGGMDQPNVSEPSPVPKVKKDVQMPTVHPTGPTQKPSAHPMAGISMPIQFHQSPVSMPYGVPNQQMQSQGVAASSLQIPMQLPLPIGSGPQVQQPMFVSGLQPHPMQHQGILHQGQNMSFTTQMAQLPNQIGNIGINIGSQYPQQQGGKYAPAPRKTSVRITNPTTHEELRFEKRTDGYPDSGSSSIRPRPNAPPQSQAIPPFAPSHPMNYYPAPYTNNMYYANPGSLPLTGGQMPPNSQAARYNYPGNPGSQNVTIVNPAARNAMPINKPSTHMHGILEPPHLEHPRDVKNANLSVSSGTTHVTVKPATGSREKGEVLSSNLPTVDKSELPKPLGPNVRVSSPRSSKSDEISTDKSLEQSKSGSDSFVSEPQVVIDQSAGMVLAVPVESQVSTSVSSSTGQSESVPVVANAESIKKESLSRSNSIKDQQKKPAKKGFSQPQRQVGDQPIPVPSLPLQTDSFVSGSVESNISPSPKLSNEDVPKASEESVSTGRITITDTSASKTEKISEGSASISFENFEVSTAADTLVPIQNSRLDDDVAVPNNQVDFSSTGTEELGGKEYSEGPNEDVSKSEVSSELHYPRPFDGEEQARQEFPAEEAATDIVISPLETAVGDQVVDDSSVDKSVSPGVSLSRGDCKSNEEVSVSKSAQSPLPLVAEVPIHEAESVSGRRTEDVTGSGVSVPSAPTGSKDKPVPELTRSKSNNSKGKKKKKELLQKADAAGTTFDLYNAYKSPEEKKETPAVSEVVEGSSSLNSQPVTDEAIEEGALVENDSGNKLEPDDWEDAADISKPKLETDNDGVSGLHDKDIGNMVKKYSRDFLLTFSEHCTDVPEDFEIPADIAEVLMSSNTGSFHRADRSPFPSPGRAMDRPVATPRLDRRNSGVMEDDRWGKVPVHFAGPSRDLRLDLSVGMTTGFRPVVGGNFGVLRNPRVQSPIQFAGGILSGPLQSVGSQGGLQRNNSDADRWQRGTNFHKGLIPSPQTPLVTMHKTENRYEVGKVTDEEQAKQRQLKSILNKLTPQNFDKLFEQVKAANIDNAQTLRGVIAQIFDKALTEPTFCEMYANFCYHLSGHFPDFGDGTEKITFKRLLLNKCQEEFERGEREQEEAEKADEEGEVKLTEAQREEKRIKARRRMLGNIRLIGELFKKKMLTERIMHECIKKLLGQNQTPDEEDVEALCKLMSTIGESIDHAKAKEHMDAYFEGMKTLSNDMKLSSRVRFMLKDSIDLRKNNWQQRRKVEGPKKIEEVHRDAAQERQAQSSRLMGRGPGPNPPGRRVPIEFAPRGPAMLSSPGSQMVGFRPQVRGFGSQDVRQDERQTFEARPLSMSLSQRPGDDITLGPQGGLARGMSIRGPVSMPHSSLADMSPSNVDHRRLAAGLNNGYSSVSDRGYSSREDPIPRYVPDRSSGQAAYDQSSAPSERSIYGGRDVRTPDPSFDRSLLSSPPSRGPAQTSTQTQSNPTEVLSDEKLREKSRTAIKEFYSARDVGEVALCIKDLNSPSFHPTMVSLWVTESFEAKDMERDLLANLLVNLTTSNDFTLSPAQLVKGFESVLETLEDTVNDAPKAPQYLGRIFAKVITESVVPLGEIGHLVHEGGEEPGSLLNSGLAGDVLGSVLDIIKSEKGESILDELIKGSSLQLETFRPPDPLKSHTLERFILGI